MLASCNPTGAPPPSSNDPLALAQWSAQGTAIAVSTVQAQEATRVHVESTGTAVAFGQQSAAATATSVSVVATATWDALLVEQKAAEVAAFQAASIAAVTATIAADNAALAYQVQEANAVLAQKQADIARKEMWNRIIPWAIGVLLFIIVGGAGTFYAERLFRSRPQQAGGSWIAHTPRGPVVIAQPSRPVALLPAPAVTVSSPVMSGDEQVSLPPLRNGHVLIAGETGSGKSTVMRTVLDSRPSVVVLDPHYSETEGWGRARVIGAGRDYGSIRDYMGLMGDMLQDRYAARAAGRMEFESLTVAVDEMPSIVDSLGTDRTVTTVWRQWLREGRKVGLYLVLSTQSTRVRTLGIEGEKDLLENFTYVLALGDVARREYGKIPGVESMAFPAVLHTKGKARPVFIPERSVDEVVVLPGTNGFNGSNGYRGHNGYHGTGATGPLLVAPVPRYYEPDVTRLTDADRLRIVDSYRRNPGNLSAVQREIFPSYKNRGGRAWNAIKDVLIETGEIERPG